MLPHSTPPHPTDPHLPLPLSVRERQDTVRRQDCCQRLANNSGEKSESWRENKAPGERAAGPPPTPLKCKPGGWGLFQEERRGYLKCKSLLNSGFCFRDWWNREKKNQKSVGPALQLVLNQRLKMDGGPIDEEMSDWESKNREEAVKHPLN